LILFGEDFDLAGAPAPAAARPPTAAEREAAAREAADAERAAAIERAYAQGVADGLARAADARAALTEHWTALCADRLRAATGELAELADRQATALAAAVMELLMRTLPALCARHGAAEAAALTRQILPGLAREPHIAVRHHPRDGEAIAAALGALPEELSGAVSLAPSAQLASGDLRITWRDGQATRDTQALLAGIADTLRLHGLLDTSPDTGPNTGPDTSRDTGRDMSRDTGPDTSHATMAPAPRRATEPAWRA
jgi:flagellar biosynthesis/type III secretory pathway protein FliH